METIKFRIWGFVLVAVVSISAGHTLPPAHMSLPPTFLFGVVEEGDFVFRRGSSLVSQAVLRVDRESPYSHVGIVVAKYPEVLVAHAAPESGDSDFKGGTIIEPLALFLSPHKSSHAGLYRLPVSISPPTIRNVALTAKEMALSYYPFDSNLDLEDSNKLYCTEFLLLALEKNDIRLPVSLSDMKLLGVEKSVLLPSALLEHLVEVEGFSSP